MINDFLKQRLWHFLAKEKHHFSPFSFLIWDDDDVAVFRFSRKTFLLKQTKDDLRSFRRNSEEKKIWEEIAKRRFESHTFKGEETLIITKAF